jgi:hypothetical protein
MTRIFERLNIKEKLVGNGKHHVLGFLLHYCSFGGEEVWLLLINDVGIRWG